MMKLLNGIAKQLLHPSCLHHTRSNNEPRVESMDWESVIGIPNHDRLNFRGLNGHYRHDHPIGKGSIDEKSVDAGVENSPLEEDFGTEIVGSPSNGCIENELTNGIELLNINGDQQNTSEKSPVLPRRMRSSSLRPSDAPPKCEHHKKIVRFADSLGLDLADVKVFLDEVPNIPSSAFSDLKGAFKGGDVYRKRNRAEVAELPGAFITSFHQPICSNEFSKRLEAQRVLLERCNLSDDRKKLLGSVRVKFRDFRDVAKVAVRYTYDDWAHCEEAEAYPVIEVSSCDVGPDWSLPYKFNITLNLRKIKIGSTVALAFRVTHRNTKEEIWDNNYDANYVFHCVRVPS